MDTNEIEVLEDKNRSIHEDFLDDESRIYRQSNFNPLSNRSYHSNATKTTEYPGISYIRPTQDFKVLLHSPHADGFEENTVYNYHQHIPTAPTLENNENIINTSSKTIPHNITHSKSLRTLPSKRQCRQQTQCNIRSLNLISLVFGLAATGFLSLAASTDFWLHTNEPFRATGNDTALAEYPHFNDTEEEYEYEDDNDTTMSSDYETSTLLIQTHSGLWRICIVYENPGLWPSC